MILLLKKTTYSYSKLLIIFLFFAISLGVASSLASSEETQVYPITLNDKTLFYIYNKSIYNNLQERARVIEDRLKQIAQEPSIKIDDIKVESWDENTNIIYGSETIITLTNADIEKTGVGLKNKRKLANQYQQKIKKAILKYRDNLREQNFFKSLLPLFVMIIILDSFFLVRRWLNRLISILLRI